MSSIQNSKMQSRIVAALALALFWHVWKAPQLHAQELTAQQVNRSIESAKDWLRNEQNRSTGRWSTIMQHQGGVDALVTLSLLLAGTRKDDPVITSSLRHLNSLDPFDDRLSVYTVSLLCMIYCEVDPDLYRARIRKCVDFLVAAQVREGVYRGGWAYFIQSSTPDGSNTQFAILALSEAARSGVEVEQRVWQNARWYWEEMYIGNGRFIYRDDQFHRSVATGSMVCAAIASLIIIDENLARPAPLDDGRVACCIAEERMELVEAANRWLSERFTTRRNPTDADSIFRDNRYYFLYSMERAARLSGQRFFGKHDWYREGAQALVAMHRNGRWSSDAGHGERDNPHVTTALALMFLSKGRRPIVIGKYKHSDDNDWDRHRKGVHYLSRALEADWEVKLSWQTIEGKFASVEDLLSAPVLFLSGRDALRLNDQQKESLKQYVEYGGFIFAEACQGDGCGNDVPFDQDFRELMSELFPDARMQLLEQSHPVYSAQYDLTVNGNWPVYGLQSSCRTSVIYCPANLAGYWRVNRPSFLDQLPDEARNEVEYTTQLGVNVVTYATGRAVKDKLDQPRIMEVRNEGPGERIVLIPKLAHGGRADDAPNAWQNILRRASFDLKERFKIEPEMISPTDEHLQKYPMVFMHGRAPFTWSKEEREAIRRHFENNGFLFTDSICSSAGFATAFRKEMKAVFPDRELIPIPGDDPIFSSDAGGYRLDSVSMHEPAANVPGGVRRYRSAPAFEGIQVDGRWVVVFSPHDLSCAMENGVASQCAGYDKDDAARLGVNVILYALNPGIR